MTDPTAIARTSQNDLLEAMRSEVESTDPGPLADDPVRKELYRILRRRGQLELEAQRVSECMRAMLDQLRSKIAVLDFVYHGRLIAITEELLRFRKERSIKTPYGVIGFRKQPTKLEIKNKEAVIAAVKAGELPDTCMKTKTETTESVVFSELQRLFAHGEIPPGCEVREAFDKFYVE